jgi:hypothetical protein
MNANLEPSQSTPELDVETKTGRKKILYLVGGILILALVLGGAAFVAGKYINNNRESTSSDSGMMVMEQGGAGGVGQFTRKIELEPAEELPDRAPEARGIFVRREDNSLFIGTGNIMIGVKAEKGSEASADISTEYDGPVVEVVVTNETVVYKDETNFGSPGSEDEGPIQQVVTSGSIDEVDQNTSFSVWGRKVGDRLIAEVLVYSVPNFVFGPQN